MAGRWLRIANLSEVPRGTNKAYNIGGCSVLLCHSGLGVFAVENRCPHQLAPLEGGKLRGAYLFCPKHGAQFDLRTGAPLGTALAKTAIATFMTRVDEHENVEIRLPGETARGLEDYREPREIPVSQEQMPLDREQMSASQERAPASPERMPATREQRNKQIVSRFLEAFSSGEVAGTMAMMTEDATWWVAGTMPISGTYDKAAFTRLLSGVLETCTGPIKIDPRSYVAEGDSVAVEAESFTQTRNGRTYNNLYHFLFKIRDGKVAAVKEYLDTMHAHAVLCIP